MNVVLASLRPAAIATPLEAPALAVLLGCVPLLIVEPAELTGALVAAALVTSLGVGFVLDDPAAVTLEASPTPLWARRGLRLLFLVVVLAVGFSLQLGVANARTPPGPGLPVRAWLVEGLALVSVTLAVSGVAQRFLPERMGGAAAAPAGFVLLFAVGVQAQLWQWLPPLPGNPHSTRWWFVVAFAVSVLAWTTRDPGSRSFRSGIRRTARQIPDRNGG